MGVEKLFTDLSIPNRACFFEPSVLHLSEAHTKPSLLNVVQSYSMGNLQEEFHRLKTYAASLHWSSNKSWITIGAVAIGNTHWHCNNGQGRKVIYIYIHTYIYTYIYRERERSLDPSESFATTWPWHHKPAHLNVALFSPSESWLLRLWEATNASGTRLRTQT